MNKEFLELITKCSPVEFLGVATMTRVAILNEDKTPKTFDQILTEVLEVFEKMNRATKRRILRIVREAVKNAD